MTLLARWRADQLTYEDTGGTDACENGDGLAAWGIYEGSQAGNLATQSTSGARPVWNSSDGGYPSVSVTGSSSQRIALAHSAPWVLTVFSFLAAIKITNGRDVHVWGRGGAWTNAGLYLDGFVENHVYQVLYFHTSYATRYSALPKPDNTSSTWFVVAGIADGSKMELYINRQSVSRILQTQTINFGTSALTLFADGSGTSMYNMTGAAREFAFWNTALTGLEMQTEIDAAMTRWGITNTVTPPASAVRPSHPMSQQVIG